LHKFITEVFINFASRKSVKHQASSVKRHDNNLK